MVTFDLETGEIIEGSFDRGNELRPEFQEDGIDYVLDEEITFPRSEMPDFLSELVPRINGPSPIKLTVEDSPEQIWLSEIEEGELTMAFFIPLSWKKAGRNSGSGLETHQASWEKIAEGLSRLYQQQSARSLRIADSDNPRNLNHLLNRRS